MKFVIEDSGNETKIIASWSDIHKGMSFLIYLGISYVGIMVPFVMLVTLGGIFFVFPWLFFVFILFSISLFLFPLYYFHYSLKYVCAIDLNKKHFALSKEEFGRSKPFKVLPFSECRSINSRYEKTRGLDGEITRIWKIVAFSKNNFKIDLIKMNSTYRIKNKTRFYDYYFDLLTLYIYHLIKDENLEFDEYKNLITKDRDLLSLNVTLDNISEFSKILAIGNDVSLFSEGLFSLNIE